MDIPMMPGVLLGDLKSWPSQELHEYLYPTYVTRQAWKRP